MSRVAPVVTCSDEDRRQLERLSSSRTEEARLVERAQIVLSCLDGERNDQIAERMERSANEVRRVGCISGNAEMTMVLVNM